MLVAVSGLRGQTARVASPDFLYAAPSMVACAAFCKESRMKLVDLPEPHRISGVGGWHNASEEELRALIPARAPVISERIETEFRTASGITDGKGHSIAGVVLITAGYSADGKYSHYFVSQVPLKVGDFLLPPGQYLLGLGARAGLTEGDVLPGAERESRGASGGHAQSLHHPRGVLSHLAAGRQAADPARPLYVQLRAGSGLMGA